MHFLISLLLLVALSETQQWPGFLGAGADPIDPATIPLEWSPEKNIAWSQTLPGYGQSSPVIWGEQVIVTTVEGKSKEKLNVLCFDLKTGQPSWRSTFDSSNPEKNSVYISRAAPTPLVDASGIYVYFESGDVVGLTHDGKSQWTRSLTKDYGKPENEFGLSASPVQTDSEIIILIDDPGKSYIVALEKQTGEVRWKTDRTSRRSWSSPSLTEIDGTLQVICSSDGSVTSYDVESGEELWTFSEVGGNTGTTPLKAGEGEFFIAASPGRRGENAELARKSNGVMTAERTDAGWVPKFVWTNSEPTPSWASPIAYCGRAYWINRVGVVYCMDLKTGKELFTKRIPQSAWATPVGIGDRLYIFGKSGLTMVLAAEDEYKLLAENRLWSEESPPVNNLPQAEEETEERRRALAMFSNPTVYGVAVVDGHLVVRTGSQLFCIKPE